MAKETYITIHNNDGDTHVESMDRETLLERIEENYWGSSVKYMHEVPVDNSDTNYWGDCVLIIKGTVVVPQAEQVITKYMIQ